MKIYKCNAPKEKYREVINAFRSQFPGFETINENEQENGSGWVILRDPDGRRVTVEYEYNSKVMSLICPDEFSAGKFVSSYNMEQEADPDAKDFAHLKYIWIPLILAGSGFLVSMLKYPGSEAFAILMSAIYFFGLFIGSGGPFMYISIFISSYLAKIGAKRWRLPMFVSIVIPVAVILIKSLTYVAPSEYIPLHADEIWMPSASLSDTLQALGLAVMFAPLAIYAVILPFIIAGDVLKKKYNI